jgi:hypothetical protein
MTLGHMLVILVSVLVTSASVAIGWLIKRSVTTLDESLHDIKMELSGIKDKLSIVVTETAVLSRVIEWLEDLHKEGHPHREQG